MVHDIELTIKNVDDRHLADLFVDLQKISEKYNYVICFESQQKSLGHMINTGELKSLSYIAHQDSGRNIYDEQTI